MGTAMAELRRYIVVELIRIALKRKRTGRIIRDSSSLNRRDLGASSLKATAKRDQRNHEEDPDDHHAAASTRCR